MNKDKIYLHGIVIGSFAKYNHIPCAVRYVYGGNGAEDAVIYKLTNPKLEN